MDISVVLLKLAGLYNAGEEFGDLYPDLRDIHVIGPYEISQDTCTFQLMDL